MFRADIFKLISCSLTFSSLEDESSYCIIGPVAHWQIPPINITIYSEYIGNLREPLITPIEHLERQIYL